MITVKDKVGREGDKKKKVSSVPNTADKAKHRNYTQVGGLNFEQVEECLDVP